MSRQFKYILDTVMTLILVLLMKITFVGLLWHEILGLGIFLLFVIHNLLNIKYFSCVLKKFFSDCVKFKVKFGIVLDLLLSLVITGIVATGIMISKEIFPFGYVGFVSSLHHSLSYLSLILISVHVGLHWSDILGAFRKVFRLERFNKARTYGLRLVTILIVLLGIKGSFNQNFSDKLLNFKNLDESEEIAENKFRNYSTKNEEDNEEDEDDTTPAESLEEFLGKLHCDGCRRHCPLTAPQCNVGVEKALEAKEGYRTSEVTKDVDDNQNVDKSSGSLEDYLSKLYCNGCSRHCPLSSPRCGIGEKEAVEATSLFYQDKIVVDGSYRSRLGEILTDFLPMMGIYIAGTHYIVMIPKYLKKRD